MQSVAPTMGCNKDQTCVPDLYFTQYFGFERDAEQNHTPLPPVNGHSSPVLPVIRVQWISGRIAWIIAALCSIPREKEVLMSKFPPSLI